MQTNDDNKKQLNNIPSKNNQFYVFLNLYNVISNIFILIIIQTNDDNKKQLSDIPYKKHSILLFFLLLFIMHYMDSASHLTPEPSLKSLILYVFNLKSIKQFFYDHSVIVNCLK